MSVAEFIEAWREEGCASPSEIEEAAVLAWCRDWAADVRSHRFSSDEALLEWCDRQIVGGLAFVLWDVRRCAGELVAGERVIPEYVQLALGELGEACMKDGDACYAAIERACVLLRAGAAGVAAGVAA